MRNSLGNQSSTLAFNYMAKPCNNPYTRDQDAGITVFAPNINTANQVVAKCASVKALTTVSTSAALTDVITVSLLKFFVL